MKRIFAAALAVATTSTPAFLAGSAIATATIRPTTTRLATADTAPAPTGDFAALERDAASDGSVRLLVTLRPATATTSAGVAGVAGARRALERDLAPTAGTVTRRFDSLGLVAIRATPATLRALEHSPFVERVGRNRILRPTLAHSVPTIQANLAAAAGYSGTGETVAIIDSGVDTSHPFLGGRVISEACFAAGESGTGDCPNGRTTQTGTGAAANCDLRIDGCAHGTHVAGIAAGAGGPVAAPNGTAPASNIMAIRVFSSISDPAVCGGISNTPCIGALTDDIIAALQYVAAHSNGVAAVNMSLGGGAFASQAACDADPDGGAGIKGAIDALRARGIATIVAAGNEGRTNALGSPACISSAISVGATGSGGSGSPSDSVAPYSNSAAFLSLLAPGGYCGLPCNPGNGTGITSSVPVDSNADGVVDVHGYAEDWGTSMAAPHVTGAFALMRQRFPSASVSELLARLKGTGAAVTDSRNGLTFHRIRIKAAMDAGTPGAPTGVSASPGIRSARVSWSAPANDGGSSITGFTVHASPTGETATAAGDATSVSLTGLKGSTDYTFTVTADNAAGTGPASAASPAVHTLGSSAAPSGIGADNTDGYWIVATNGRVFNYGTAKAFGTATGLTLSRPVVGASSTVSGRGLWMVAGDGGIFSFGDAAFYGSTGAIHLNQPIVGMSAAPTGAGYWLVARDGGIFGYGDAAFYGSTGAIHLNQPIVGMAPTPSGRGYWLVARDGGIFAFGDAAFLGSTGAIHLNQPIVGMAATATGNGYQFVAADGGIFNFGDAAFHGAAAGSSWFPLVGIAR